MGYIRRYATSSVAQLPRPAPKAKGIDEARQSSVQMNFGFQVRSTNNNATNFCEHRVPITDPVIRNPRTNSSFLYPIRINKSPMKLNITVYVSGNSGVLEGAINNEQFLSVQTPQTASSTTYGPTPVMQFIINQPIVPSLVGFRLRVVQDGYNIRSFDLQIA